MWWCFYGLVVGECGLVFVEWGGGVGGGEVSFEVESECFEFCVHLFFFALCAPVVGLVWCVFGDEDDGCAWHFACGASSALDCADFAWYWFVEDDEVCGRDVESFFGDAGCYEDVVVAGFEAVDDVDLFFLAQSFVVSFASLSDESDGVDAGDVCEVGGHEVGGVAVVGEKDDFGVRIHGDLVADDGDGFWDFRVVDFCGVGGGDGVEDVGVFDEVFGGFAAAFGGCVGVDALEVVAEGGDALCLEQFDGVVDFEGCVLCGGCGVELVGWVGGGAEALLDVGLEFEEFFTVDGLCAEVFAEVLGVEVVEACGECFSEVGEDAGEVGWEWDFFEGDVEVVDVGFDVGVLWCAYFDVVDAEVGADFEDFLEVVAGRGGHGEGEAVLAVSAVGLGDEDVGVVADGAVGFVEDDERDFVEGEASGDEVVFDDLGGADDDVVAVPEGEAFVWCDFAGEHGDGAWVEEVFL